MKFASPFVMMRGGTSKGVFFDAYSVPKDRGKLADFLLDAFGSPDRRQIDGLGGADKLTSKAAIIGRPVIAGTDVTYLYGHVGIVVPEVDFNANCGNLLAAVAVYAIEEGYVEPTGVVTQVRIHNLNTDKVIVAHVPVQSGEVVTEGDFAIAGVPGTGAPIALDLSRTAGAKTGRLLPLARPVTAINVAGLGRIEVSVVDLANLVIYVRAESLGMLGTEDPVAIDNSKVFLEKFSALRGAVSKLVGMGEYWDRGGEQSSPKLVVVREPVDYENFATGQIVKATDMDIVCRLFSSGSASKTLAATVTACTGAAVKIPGTIPHQIAGKAGCTVRIGHPSGIIPVEVEVGGDETKTITICRIYRTARRIAEGSVYLKRDYAGDSV